MVDSKANDKQENVKVVDKPVPAPPTKPKPFTQDEPVKPEVGDVKHEVVPEPEEAAKQAAAVADAKGDGNADVWQEGFKAGVLNILQGVHTPNPHL